VRKAFNRIQKRSVQFANGMRTKLNKYDHSSVFAIITVDLFVILPKLLNLLSYSRKIVISIGLHKLKKQLISCPIMVHPDFSKPFILQVDASNFGIGVVLTQCDGKGKDHLIAYWSRKLTVAETK